MPWTETTHPIYARDYWRYASDLTDGEWALISPMMPALGRDRATAKDRPARGRERVRRFTRTLYGWLPRGKGFVQVKHLVGRGHVYGV